jgi:hypothetical protein
MIAKLLQALAPHARLILCVLGLVFLVAGAWTYAPPLGLAATGVALLLLEWRVE